ncbi:MAG: SRPBCC domain-containing protein [Candidatus Marinimicrobia bacterium]|nr:SRPBCC domain-containing protein [Candidatus Neomarinimicrobiota bacterium]
MSGETPTRVTTRAIGDAAVEAATGRPWDAWLEQLDRAGARELDHKSIVALVGRHEGVSPWWQQMVTVTYEQARGLRKKHEMADGYQISRSKTVAAPADQLYTAFADPARRSLWLAHTDLAIRKATPYKSLRMSWGACETEVRVEFTPKGPEKTQVVVQHSKLADPAEADAMKANWGQQLAKLTALLED